MDELVILKSYKDVKAKKIEWIWKHQPILIFNYKNKGNEKPLLTEDEVELLTTPQDIANFKNAITEALLKGTKRNIESEETKNVVGE